MLNRKVTFEKYFETTNKKVVTREIGSEQDTYETNCFS